MQKLDNNCPLQKLRAVRVYTRHGKLVGDSSAIQEVDVDQSRRDVYDGLC